MLDACQTVSPGSAVTGRFVTDGAAGQSVPSPPVCQRSHTRHQNMGARAEETKRVIVFDQSDPADGD